MRLVGRVEKLFMRRGNRAVEMAVIHTPTRLSTIPTNDHQCVGARLTGRQRLLKTANTRVD